MLADLLLVATAVTTVVLAKRSLADIERTRAVVRYRCDGAATMLVNTHRRSAVLRVGAGAYGIIQGTLFPASVVHDMGLMMALLVVAIVGGLNYRDRLAARQVVRERTWPG